MWFLSKRACNKEVPHEENPDVWHLVLRTGLLLCSIASQMELYTLDWILFDLSVRYLIIDYSSKLSVMRVSAVMYGQYGTIFFHAAHRIYSTTNQTPVDTQWYPRQNVHFSDRSWPVCVFRIDQSSTANKHSSHYSMVLIIQTWFPCQCFITHPIQGT